MKALSRHFTRRCAHGYTISVSVLRSPKVSPHGVEAVTIKVTGCPWCESTTRREISE
jgi:hypothetical protein